MLYKFLSGLAKGVTHCNFQSKSSGQGKCSRKYGQDMILAVNHKM